MEFTLKPHPVVRPPKGPVVVVVMDGMGHAPPGPGNAVHLAFTPTLDALWAERPHLLLKAHGTAVGLPSDKDMGNSEVGHNALGAGRIIDQGAKLVNRAIETGAIFESEAWRAIRKRCLVGGSLHLIGLLSDGNVHSHIDQLFALLRRARKEAFPRVFVHILLDGRDVPETSALAYVDALEAVLAELHDPPDYLYRIASGGGRMVTTMDRYEADWRIVERGWKAHVLGEARPFPTARAAIETFRAEQPGIIDQFLPPFVVAEAGRPVGPIRDGDSVIFFNFRGDRAIEISRAFEEDEFPYFDRGPRPDVFYAGMTLYDGDLQIPKHYLVAPPSIDRTMGEYLARNGYRQVACAETQKFGHVTYFWNGNRSGMFADDLERYIEVPSDRVPFEQRPWMRAAEATDAFLGAIEDFRPHFARINYANGDMVGHTGVLRAARLAVESVDLCLDRLVEAVLERGGRLLVTADHGNADEMFELDKKTGEILRDEKGRPKPKTSHTLNPVPFILVTPEGDQPLSLRTDVPNPGLANVAATALELMGLVPPEDYEPSLLGWSDRR